MAIISGTKKILKSDIPDADGWFTPIISVLNEFLDTVIGALRGKLTFRDNFYCELKEFTFTHGTELEVLTGLSTYAGAFITKTPNEASSDYIVTGFKVRQVKTKTLGITVNFSGGAGTEGKVKFLILG